MPEMPRSLSPTIAIIHFHLHTNHYLTHLPLKLRRIFDRFDIMLACHVLIPHIADTPIAGMPHLLKIVIHFHHLHSIICLRTPISRISQSSLTVSTSCWTCHVLIVHHGLIALSPHSSTPYASPPVASHFLIHYYTRQI